MFSKRHGKKSAYFSKGELALWFTSSLLIVLFFLIFDRENYLTLAASLIGATSLIFNAKGNPFGQVLMILFSILYGVISYTFAYYGEMITYLGMTAPMSAFALVSWLKNPYNNDKSQVKVNSLKKKEILFLIPLTAAVTAVFYFILAAFNTNNLILSTVSVATSFLAVYLTARRSALYAIGYAANDVVLIAMWIKASLVDRSYISVVICFLMFLANDIYGFINWTRMKKKQERSGKDKARPLK